MLFFLTPPLPIIDKLADAQHTSGKRRTSDIRLIVLHATVGNLESSLSWLTTNPSSNVSTHRLIDDDTHGTIYKICDDLTIANHVGFSRMGNRLGLNLDALGIEFVNSNSGRDSYGDAQIESGVLQVREWYGLYGALPIVSHASIDTKGKTDPAGFPWNVFYKRFFVRLRDVL